MLKCFLIMLAFIFITESVYAQKDTLFFINGTVVIGEVKKIQLGVITFDPDDANDITVQLRKLSGINATSRNFRIETVNDEVLFGKLMQSDKNGIATISYGTDTTTVQLNNISNLYPIEKGFFERLNGTAGAGYSYTRSTELGRFNFDLNARYATPKMEYAATFSMITNIEKGNYSRDNEDANLTASYYFHPVWYMGGIVSYQRNLELGINSRVQEGLGMGNKILLTRFVRLLGNGGMVFNQEKSSEGNYSGVLTELFLGITLNIFRFEKPELDIQTTQYGFFSISQERIRYNGDISISWEMIEDLDLKLSFYSDYDSKPPGELSANYDYGTVISVAFEF